MKKKMAVQWYKTVRQVVSVTVEAENEDEAIKMIKDEEYDTKETDIVLQDTLFNVEHEVVWTDK